jgi:hypothetical protein
MSRADLGKNVLIVCGEDPPKVRACLKGLGYELISLAHCRESHTYRLKKGRRSFTLVISGYGSASVACVVYELEELGAENLILAGTCGASSHFRLDEPLVLLRARINPLGGSGAVGFYTHDPMDWEFFPSNKLLRQTRGLRLKRADISHIISSDTFYGFSCVLDRDGRPVYRGPPIADRYPAGYEKFRRLYRSQKPYLLDMEVGFFYALCGIWKKLNGLAIKAPSNYVPFENGHPPIRDESKALRASLQAAADVILALETNGQRPSPAGPS